jgi:hypothetical protein
MTRFNNQSRHSQRTALPPRCSFQNADPLTKNNLFCRMPSAGFLDGIPLCEKHLKWLDEPHE